MNKNTKNTVIGLVLIGAILIGFSILNAPSEKEVAEKRTRDSIAYFEKIKSDSIAVARQVAENKAKAVVQDSVVAPAKDSAVKNDLKDKMGIFSEASQGEKKYINVQTGKFNIKFSNEGGRIYAVQLREYRTYDTLPVMLFDGDSSIFDLNFFANNRSINTGKLFFVPFINGKEFNGKDTIRIQNADSLTFSMRLFPDSAERRANRFIEFLYTLKQNDYMVGCKINFHGFPEIIMANNNMLNLDWKFSLPKQEKSIESERAASTIYYKFANDDEVDYISETSDDKEQLKTKVAWLAFKQQFFTTVLIAEKGFNNADIETVTDKESKKNVKNMSALISVSTEPGVVQTIPMKFFFGPTHFGILKSYDMDLERQIPLGWGFPLLAWINRFAVIPVFNFLDGFGWNYGIIILILTILLKIILLPIAFKTYKSSAKMKILKPEIDEINKKFPKEKALEKQQATMALYKKAGVSPMAGCIPMLLQLPILIAFYRFFPASIELRQESFLWATDLSTYDSILNLSFNIPFYGDHVSLFTLLMTVSTLIYTWQNNQMMSGSSQMPQMKVMMYIMPVLFLGIFNNFAAALSYYYFLANMLTFAQVYLFKFFIDEEKLHRQIEENKKKPSSQKKSRFQAKLEEMAKAKGYKGLPKR